MNDDERREKLLNLVDDMDDLHAANELLYLSSLIASSAGYEMLTIGITGWEVKMEMTPSEEYSCQTLH